jgi:O-antigen ligase
MRKIMKFLLYAYVFFASWTEAYKLSDWLRIPNIILIAIMSLFILTLFQSGIIYKRIFKNEDLFLVIFLITITFGFMINGGNFNYIVAYVFTFVINYVVLKLICFQHFDMKKLFRINAIAVLFVSIFVVLEFGGHYFFNTNIRKIMQFGNVYYEATYLVVFNRAYGFSTEPTNLGFYFNALGPLAIWYWLKLSNLKQIKKALVLCTMFLGWIFTFSASAFGAFAMSAFAIILLKSKKKIKISMNKLLLFFILLTLVITSYTIYTTSSSSENNIPQLINPILNKISLTGQASQENSRINLWARDLYRAKEKPILGYGPGSTTIGFGGSSVNWYLTVLVENGVLALLCILLFFFFTFKRMIQSKLVNRNYFLLGFIASCIHLATISTFYDPAIWLLIILFNVSNEQNKKQILELKDSF